jgi:WD40 repeat protein
MVVGWLDAGVATSLGVWVHDGDNPDDPMPWKWAGASVAASNSNRRGSDNGTVYVWISEHKQQASLKGIYYGAAAFSADGTMLASGDDSGIVRLWT